VASLGSDDDERTAVNAVLWDLGGVLLDWDPRYLYRKLLPDEAAVDRFLAEVVTPEWNHSLDEGRTFAEAIAERVEAFPSHADLILAYRDRWDETLAGAVPGTEPIVRDLAAAGVPQAGLTNFSAETFPVARARFEVLGLLDPIVVSGVEGVAKPDPRLFQLALERAHLTPASTVYVDDRADNVEVAASLGLRAVRFDDAVALRAAFAGFGLPVR
jgi:2-haloacid dehalogenase